MRGLWTLQWSQPKWCNKPNRESPSYLGDDRSGAGSASDLAATVANLVEGISVYAASSRPVQCPSYKCQANLRLWLGYRSASGCHFRFSIDGNSRWHSLKIIRALNGRRVIKKA